MINEDKIWNPSTTFIESSNLYQFMQFVNLKYNFKFQTYSEMHQWSVSDLNSFWESIALYFTIDFDRSYQKAVVPKVPFYKTEWFKGSQLSYTYHIQRNFKDQQVALHFSNEQGKKVEITWNALIQRAQQIQDRLLTYNIKKGDCVVGYLLNHPDTIACFLAVNSLGAIWSCCSPDFGIESVVSRFEQLQPKVLLSHTNYCYNGKHYDQQNKIEQLKLGLGSLRGTFEFSGDFSDWDLSTTNVVHLECTSVDFNDPIWILFSSGTTGNPKAITHRTGGMLLEQIKALSLHQNVQSRDLFFWNTTTGWMMWNYALGALLCDAVLCLYDGSPTYPDLGMQWRLAHDLKINHFGNGAPFFSQSVQSNLNELSTLNLTSIKTIGSTGAPLNQATFKGLHFKLPDAQIISLSGGTDVCSAFLGGNSMLPVYAGYIQCVMLGASIAAWNENGEPLLDQTGELVLTVPMPCMPLFFWGDPNFDRYHASYFDHFEGVWSHGDWIVMDSKKGIEVQGRSDATLNRNGIRIGTAEIYNVLDQILFVNDHLIIEIQDSDKHSILVLFVVMDLPLDSIREKEIKKQIRIRCSPRHVPDRIFKVKEIPYTLSGKKMEVPVKKIFLNVPKNKIATLGAMKNPNSLEEFFKLKDHFDLQRS
ncbi:MAG: acetoacetate--CoA ligase [Flavobacteriaceae bacterium]